MILEAGNLGGWLAMGAALLLVIVIGIICCIMNWKWQDHKRRRSDDEE